MAGGWGVLGFFFLLSGCFSSTFFVAGGDSTRTTYIAYVDGSAKPEEFTDHLQWYSSLVRDSVSPLAAEETEEERILYTYGTAFHGVAARLGEDEVERLRVMKALNPGLIYDIQPQEYFDFLCSQGLHSTELAVFAKFSRRTCHRSVTKPGDLNYPAISAVFPETQNVTTVTLRRTATNVGSPNSTYHPVISSFKGATVKVKPANLVFSAEKKSITYEITFITKTRPTAPEFGSIIWKDGVHAVRSPIVITWLPPL